MKFFICCSLGLLLVCTLATTAMAATYRWVDGQGRVHFGDSPPPDVAAQKLDLPPTPPSTDVAKPKAKPASLPAEAPSAPLADADLQVEIYVTDWCTYCRRAEEWFRSRRIPFTAYDVEKDAAAAQRKARLSRSRGVPLVMICGQAIPGYSVKAFEEAIDECSEKGQRK